MDRRPALCRLGAHAWPDTPAYAAGARCSRCGRPRGLSSLADRLRSFWPFT